MGGGKTKTFALFSYGTLQQSEVQVAVLGRTVSGEPDALGGFVEAPILIEGETYLTLRPGDGVVRGVVLQLSNDELRAVDAYEGTAHYVRVEVKLQSGREAFVFVSAEG